MEYTLHTLGGLGDFFCFMASPFFKRHPIRLIPQLIRDGNIVNIHVYSDNPDSANIFVTNNKNLKVFRHKHSEYKNDDSLNNFPIVKKDMLKTYAELDGVRAIKQVRENPFVIIHPFTTTKCKMWLTSNERKNQLIHTIDLLITKYKAIVVILGKTTPEVYFGEKVPWEVTEIFKYEREGLLNCVNSSPNGSIVNAALSFIIQATHMICIDSAYMMARWYNPNMKVLSLFPDTYEKNNNLFNEFYYLGLNNPPNMYTFYKKYYESSILEQFMNNKNTAKEFINSIIMEE